LNKFHDQSPANVAKAWLARETKLFVSRTLPQRRENPERRISMKTNFARALLVLGATFILALASSQAALSFPL